jgi:DNA-binding GntR family transcriptional regulator
MRTVIQKGRIQDIKARLGESLKKKWGSKVMHSQYIRSMDRRPISIQDTFLWLKRGLLKGNTESEIIAAQD